MLTSITNTVEIRRHIIIYSFFYYQVYNNLTANDNNNNNSNNKNMNILTAGTPENGRGREQAPLPSFRKGGKGIRSALP